jgi:hypothetical protein
MNIPTLLEILRGLGLTDEDEFSIWLESTQSAKSVELEVKSVEKVSDGGIYLNLQED